MAILIDSVSVDVYAKPAGVRVKLELFVVFGHWLPPSVRQVYRTITDL